MHRTMSLRRGSAVLLAAVGSLVWLGGCASPMERAYGLSQRQHIERMTENPLAGIDDLEARRPDGASTAAALVKMRKQELQKQEASAPSVINVDIGGGG